MGENLPKFPQTTPNGHKIYKMAVKYIDQMAIKISANYTKWP
jgi:hypothetical protein